MAPEGGCLYKLAVQEARIIIDRLKKMLNRKIYNNKKRIDELEERIKKLELNHMTQIEVYELDLKPCPRCGEKAKFIEDDCGTFNLAPNHNHWIECSKCGLRTMTVKGWEEDLAIKLWNERN